MLSIVLPHVTTHPPPPRARAPQSFEPQNLANTAWAFATVGLEARPLFEALTKVGSLCLNSFEPQHIANILWSLAANGHCSDVQFWQRIWGKALACIVRDVDLAQLQQARLFAMHIAPQLRLAPAPPEMVVKLRAAFSGAPAKASRSQEECSAALHRIGWPHADEHFTVEGHSIDMANVATRVGVEFDGPTHYLNDASTLNGTTGFKKRLLQAEGWTIVSIKYSDWDRVVRSFPDQETFVRGRLESAGVKW